MLNTENDDDDDGAAPWVKALAEEERLRQEKRREHINVIKKLILNDPWNFIKFCCCCLVLTGLVVGLIRQSNDAQKFEYQFSAKIIKRAV